MLEDVGSCLSSMLSPHQISVVVTAWEWGIDGALTVGRKARELQSEELSRNW